MTEISANAKDKGVLLQQHIKLGKKKCEIEAFPLVLSDFWTTVLVITV